MLGQKTQNCLLPNMYSGHLDNQGKGFRQTTLKENKKKINLNECTDVLHILLYQIPVKQIIAY